MARPKPKYPNVIVTLDLSGPDGNAYVIMACVSAGLQRAGVSEKERKQYEEESTSSDYDNLLNVARKWVTFNTYNAPPRVAVGPK